MPEQLDPSYYWLIFGIVCILVEAAGLSGVGFFFAGLASICVGILVEVGILAPHAYIAQAAWFFALTVIWAAVLWRPLKRYYLNRGNGGYSNIIGEIATVSGDGLARGREGVVTWSGTIMKAEISPTASIEFIPAGSPVMIQDVKGAKLIVVPKP